MNSDKRLYSAKLRSLTLTKSNPCYITVSATLVLLGAELTMPRPRLFSVLIFSTKHISLRREQNSKRPAKVLIVTPLPLRITVMNLLTLCPDLKNLAVFTPFNNCDVLFYVSLKKKHTAKFSLLTLSSYFNQLVLRLYLLFTLTLLTLSLTLSHLTKLLPFLKCRSSLCSPLFYGVVYCKRLLTCLLQLLYLLITH